MAKVITFSRVFPSTHPKKGQPTYFVEKFYNSLQIDIRKRSWIGMLNEINDKEIPSLQMLAGFVFGGINYNETGIKHHTIRAGHRFKAGDYFSPRVWSGKPYNSKQIIIAPDTLIVKTWDFRIEGGCMTEEEVGLYKINGKPIGKETYPILSNNDGLTEYDMFNWFNPTLKIKPFDGQIICWNKDINY